MSSGFGARAVAQQGSDVAEIALEWAAARKLHTHGIVMLEFDQVPAGGRRQVDVGEIGSGIQRLGTAGFKICQEQRERDFGFVQDEMRHPLKLIMLAGEQGAAGYYRYPGGVAAGDDFDGGIALHHHPGEEHIVRPGQIFIGERAHVGVHQTLLPLWGQHGRHGDQAKRRRRCFFADEAEGVAETPKCIREFRVYQ